MAERQTSLVRRERRFLRRVDSGSTLAQHHAVRGTAAIDRQPAFRCREGHRGIDRRGTLVAHLAMDQFQPDPSLAIAPDTADVASDTDGQIVNRLLPFHLPTSRNVFVGRFALLN